MIWCGFGLLVGLIICHDGSGFKNSIKKVSFVPKATTEETRIGHAHTEESRAKISAANKGKLPWNAGKKHDEVTKLKIAEKTREAMAKKKLERAQALGLTLEEYDMRKKQVKKEKQKENNKGGLTEEGRRKISESVKKRWESPNYKQEYTAMSRGNRNHSQETRAKISEAIKLKWQDTEYRSKIGSPPSDEVRARISNTLKLRWEDPEFRGRMTASINDRDEGWKTKVSLKIKSLWESDAYRSNVVEGLRASNKTQSSVPRRRSSSSSVRVARKLISPEEKLQRQLQVKEAKKQKEAQRRLAIQLAKKAQKDQQNRQSLKELLGRELWFEEKMKRRKDGDSSLLNDEELEKVLAKSWGEEDEDDDTTEGAEEDDGDMIVEDWELSDSDDNDDVIEVYDEDGELVCTYNAQEYAKLRAAKKL